MSQACLGVLVRVSAMEELLGSRETQRIRTPGRKAGSVAEGVFQAGDALSAAQKFQALGVLSQLSLGGT